MFKIAIRSFKLCTLCILTVIGIGDNVYAACSAGIPCLDYDIYTTNDAATDTSLNALKSDGTASPPSPYNAYENTACDANFMNQIYSKAWMEASREVIMSEQLIHKPDSVLEYTCFDNRIKATANHAGKPFSEYDETVIETWNERDVCLSSGDQPADYSSDPPTCAVDTTLSQQTGNLDLSNILQTFLMGDLQSYIDSNFGHTFMGEALTIDNDIDTSSIPDDDAYEYVCTHMSTVWNIAKCIDFGEDDRFRSFEHLVDFDPRTIPVACSPGFESSDTVEAGSDPTKLDSTASGDVSDGLTEPCPASTIGSPPTTNTGFTADHIRVANNCDDGSNLNVYASFDSVELFDEITRGIGNYVPGVGNAAGTIICSQPLPTGVPVITYRYTQVVNPMPGPFAYHGVNKDAQIHYDHICPNPGCIYQPVKVPYVIGSALPAAGSSGLCVPP